MFVSSPGLLLYSLGLKKPWARKPQRHGYAKSPTFQANGLGQVDTRPEENKERGRLLLQLHEGNQSSPKGFRDAETFHTPHIQHILWVFSIFVVLETPVLTAEEKTAKSAVQGHRALFEEPLAGKPLPGLLHL